ncbi:hypothetical protein C7H19_20050 [Aphanothece hegewaldii CCALA 016]|uniref:Uncharacterized protein n=1 Tax=Aphanothece hegewaldii CCALA 016 TaxID=2107694 RepID=A0A2T1LTC7_9CHRO|nr:hypothetical protein [Aphanothece hegewaldii]PSF33464.1 hypothetical protein C7H19_20050 [Aphanothece hegewaldii CCALA 016]
MNQLTLQLAIVALTTEHTAKGNLIVHGVGQFVFTDKNEQKTAAISFTAYGAAALTMMESGENANILAIGRFDITPPSDECINHQCLFNITQAIFLNVASMTDSTETPQTDKVDLALVEF